MITPAKMIFGIVCGFLGGLVFFVEAVHAFAVRNAPVVTGHIVAREPIRQFSVPRVDFTMRLNGTETEVHAHTQRYLMTSVPDVVRFRYSGDPSREGFLFEYEENPYWIVLCCWGGSLFLLVCLRSPRIRELLARTKPKPDSRT